MKRARERPVKRIMAPSEPRVRIHRHKLNSMGGMSSLLMYRRPASRIAFNLMDSRSRRAASARISAASDGNLCCRRFASARRYPITRRTSASMAMAACGCRCSRKGAEAGCKGKGGKVAQAGGATKSDPSAVST